MKNRLRRKYQAPEKPRRESMRINPAIVANKQDFVQPSGEELAAMYAAPKTLGYTEQARMAMDSALDRCGYSGLLSHAIGLGYGSAKIAPQFLGYPYLAGLAQDALIRAGVCTVADDMTKRWIKLGRKGVDDHRQLKNDQRLNDMATAMDDFGFKEFCNEAAQKCDFDGGCLVFIDTGERREEILSSPLVPGKHLKKRIRRFTLIEAINTYPGLYQALDPLNPHYFRPSHWLILGRRVHRSRLLYFAPNQLPLFLRPAYNFYGIPAAQQALDYLAHFEKTREAAQRLLTKFSLTILKTDIAAILAGGSDTELRKRVDYFTQYRDNDGTEVIDKEAEDIIQINTPLAGTTDIVRQALEFVSAVFRIPVTKFLGISPAGMNATGEYDLRNYYDHVASKQKKIFGEPLRYLLDILQMHLFEDIDPEITADFCPLSDEDDTQRATTQKTKADTGSVLIDRGVISQEEERRRLSEDPNSGYGFLDPEDVPEMPGLNGFEGQEGDGGPEIRDFDYAGEVA